MIDVITNPGKEYNEDDYLIGDNYVIVLDGASGHSMIPKHGFATNAMWLNDHIKSYAQNNLNKDISSEQFLNDLFAYLNEQYCELDSDFEASSGMVLYRKLNDCLEVTSLGDLTTLVKKKDGSVIEIQDYRIKENDDKLRDEIKAYARHMKIPFLEAKLNFKDKFRKNRTMKNKPNGYSVVSTEGNISSIYVQVIFDLDEINSLKIMTDGAYEYLDTMKLCDTNKQLMVLSDQQIIDNLRRAQKIDIRCEKNKRFKTHDDATIVKIKL